jgi:glutaredoxin
MLDLYILETCPYCKKVMTYLDEHNIEYNKIDISEKQNEDALIQLGGKRQVPFLADKDRNIQMYESADIIEYLKTIH